MNQPKPIECENLIRQAIAAQERAYAPYSHYKVGAAVQTEGGAIFTGCNIENAVYPLCLCAERVAIFKAVSEGAQRISAIAVVTANGGTPCGACRQVLREFSDLDTPVFIAWPDGTYREYTLDHLLPESFSQTDLPTDSEHR
ncbi:MAG: cytidine deaminase [Anaerolineae bacterium]|jgi:cytidine deaminase|nr:cytidine deaminase [Anaerolineae bacterium]